MKLTGNEPAMPMPGNTDIQPEYGLTVRQHFAAMAMQSLIRLQQKDEKGNIRQVWWVGTDHDREKLAEVSCKLADALFNELNK